VHGSSHEGMVFSGVRALNLPAFMSVKHHVMGWARIVFASVYIALLCLQVCRLFMCLFMQHDSMWMHVLFCWFIHRLHSGEISCLRICFFYLW
jgi:hypothetical protein